MSYPLTIKPAPTQDYVDCAVDPGAPGDDSLWYENGVLQVNIGQDQCVYNLATTPNGSVVVNTDGTFVVTGNSSGSAVISYQLFNHATGIWSEVKSRTFLLPPQQTQTYPDRVNYVTQVINLDLGDPYWNPDGNTHTVFAGALPTGVSMDANGIVTGTLGVLGGTFPGIGIDATNAEGTTQGNLWTWTVSQTDPTQPPVFAGPIPDQEDPQFVAIVNRDFGTYFANYDTLTISGLPQGLVDNGDGSVSGTPNQYGTWYTKVTATNPNTSISSNQFKWVITPVLKQGGKVKRKIDRYGRPM